MSLATNAACSSRRNDESIGLAAPPFSAAVHLYHTKRAMEEWDFVDVRELQSWKGARICLTCQHFAYGVDGYCRTMVACNLKQQQLQQGDHLIKRCRHWSPTWQDQAGWC